MAARADQEAVGGRQHGCLFQVAKLIFLLQGLCFSSLVPLVLHPINKCPTRPAFGAVSFQSQIIELMTWAAGIRDW